MRYNRRHYQPLSILHDFSDEEMARDWTLSTNDKRVLERYRKDYRVYVAVQMCSIRMYGRFLSKVHDLSPRIVNYLNNQLDLPPSLAISIPERKATYLDQHKNVLNYLGFQKFNEETQDLLEDWIKNQARKGALPNDLFNSSESFLLST